MATGAEIAARVDAVITRSLRTAERAMYATGPEATRRADRLERLLREADAELSRRLSEWNLRSGGDNAAFTPSSLRAYQAQVRFLSERARAQVFSETNALTNRAWRTGAIAASNELRDLERAFTGIARTPRVRQAMMFDVSRGRAASVLRSSETSVDRYGAAMIGEFERHMQLGFAAGLTQGEMVEMLTGHGGPRGEVSMRARVVGGQVVRVLTEQIPEGLFTRYRSWAWRIARTESANAYNAAKIESLHELAQNVPGLKKKILAHFDTRTATDSVAVHGQIRDLSGPNRFFVDGAGRVYEHSPARPNDRETVIPWEDSWSDTPSTQQLSQVER